MSDEARCGICGEPMPEGEEMFKYHGYSGPCPKPPLSKTDARSRLPVAQPRIVVDGIALYDDAGYLSTEPPKAQGVEVELPPLDETYEAQKAYGLTQPTGADYSIIESMARAQCRERQLRAEIAAHEETKRELKEMGEQLFDTSKLCHDYQNQLWTPDKKDRNAELRLLLEGYRKERGHISCQLKPYGDFRCSLCQQFDAMKEPQPERR